MVTTKPDLRWLFSAHFADGHAIHQDAEDTSQTEAGKSAFYDVLAYTDSPLVWFVLHHTEHDQNVSVDLIRGTFAHNGILYDINDPDFDPSNHDLEVIYSRHTRAEITPEGPQHYVAHYTLGWRCMVDGAEKKATIAVA